MEKFCNSCKQAKPISEYRPNKSKKDGLQGYCIACDKIKQKEYYNKNIKKLRAERRVLTLNRRRKNVEFLYKYLLEHPCIDCGEKDPIVLDFDHKDGKQKFKNISEMMCYSLTKIIEEINKCEVRCSNCHRRKTAKQLGWYMLKLQNGS